MAKFVINFDTVEKTLEVKKDGETIENVKSVSLYPSYSYGGEEDMCCQILTMTEDETSDIKTMTTLMASKNLKDDVSGFVNNFLGK